jgi:hypothetical protein
MGRPATACLEVADQLRVGEVELEALRGAGAGAETRGTQRPVARLMVATWLMAGTDRNRQHNFLLGAVQIWESRRHGGGLGGGGGPATELVAAVVSSWAATTCSGLGAELGQRRARFEGVRGVRLLETSVPYHVGPTCLRSHYAHAGGAVGDSLRGSLVQLSAPDSPME